MTTEKAPALATVGEQAKSLWDGLSLARRLMVVAVFGLLGVAVVSASRYEPEPDYAVLFSDLTVEDGASVAERLRTDNVKFRLRSGGRIIEVPREKVDELRLALSADGVARGGVGFELFDKQNFGTSSFVERLNHQRALSGELSRTISSLDAVRSARVHLAMPARSLFRREEVPPSASVAVQLESGRTLSAGQIKGIVRLVGASVPKLSQDHIAVVDEAGAVLWSGDEDELATGTQRQIEKTLSKRVQDLLDRIVGPDQSMVIVTAVMERGEQETTEERYDAESPVLRSETTSEDRRPSRIIKSGQVVGSQANLPAGVNNPTKQVAKKEEDTAFSTRRSETKNFEINRIVRREQSARVRLGKLHIAILINDPSAQAGADTATVTDGLQAPSKADLDRVAALAKEAAGLDPERGDRLEIHAMPFASAAIDAGTPDDSEKAEAEAAAAWMKWIPAGLAGGLLVVIGLLAFIVWKRRGGSSKATKEGDMANITLPISASDLEDLLGTGGPKGPAPLEELKERIRAAARQDSALAARILSTWIVKKHAGEKA